MALPKARILVADDERNIRKNLALVLEAVGHTVDEAKDGDEALDLCKRNHPDIAFVDLHMPKMEGLKVLAHIRALSPNTAVVSPGSVVETTSYQCAACCRSPPRSAA